MHRADRTNRDATAGRAAVALAAVVLTALVLTACSAPGAAPPPAQTPVSTSASGAANPSSVPAGTPATTTHAVPASPLSPTVAAPEQPAPAPADSAVAESAVAEPAPAEPTSEPGSPPETGFVSTISEIDPATAARMSTSWRSGCPVALSDLRYLTVTYRGFDATDHQGELVVANSVASDVVDIFGQLYAAGYPIESLRLVDDFGGSDDESMAANNSSAFNCRPITGGGGFSEHSFGTAIDLNPVQNPYLSGSLVLPEQGRPYVDRQSAPGVIEPGDAVTTAFTGHGWTWGGTWNGPIDYQHFSVSGR